jgi:HSP20 family protein
MSNLVRRDSGNRYRDPFAFARDLFALDFGDARAPAAFMPAFEVKENAEAFVVRADIPGVKEENVDVSFHNGVLSIAGVRSAEERKEGEAFFVYERQYGSFSRSFALPETADADRIEAKMENGVLMVSIGKRAEAKPRKIELKKGNGEAKKLEAGPRRRA